jgi:hypothetical protein
MTIAILLFLSMLVSDESEIRILNGSKVPIERVRIWFPEQTEDFGTIPPKGVTGYRPVRKPYCLARVEAVVDGKPAIIQPFDHVGEKRLEPGKKYSYILTVNGKATSEFDRLKLKCRRE